LPVVALAILLLATVSLVGLALYEGVTRVVEMVRQPRPRPPRVGKKVANWKSLSNPRR
jgi:hypothetical protein